MSFVTFALLFLLQLCFEEGLGFVLKNNNSLMGRRPLSAFNNEKSKFNLIRSVLGGDGEDDTISLVAKRLASSKAVEHDNHISSEAANNDDDEAKTAASASSSSALGTDNKNKSENVANDNAAASDDNDIQRAREWIRKFSTALSLGDASTALSLFSTDPPKSADDTISTDSLMYSDDNKQHPPFWRDMVAYTWNIITFEGSDSISKALQATIGGTTATTITTTIQWKLSTSPPTPIMRTSENILEFWCDIDLIFGIGKAHVRLNEFNRATTVLTVLTQLKKKPFAVKENRIRGHQFGPIQGRKYWPELLQERHIPLLQLEQQQQQQQNDAMDNDKDDYDYYVMIIGGGQAGLSLGARLHLLDVPYLIVESDPQPGYTWKNKRYPSLHLHDPVWYNHMPYIPYPDSWPILCPGTKIADWLEMYAKVMDLNIQCNTRVMKATPISSTHTNTQSNKKQQQRRSSSNNKSNANEGKVIQFWDIEIEVALHGKEKDDGNDDDDGEKQGNNEKQYEGKRTSASSKTTIRKTIRAKHVIFATGNSSRPKVPSIPGAKTNFRGLQLHSTKYRGGRHYKNKNVMVLGSNNSALDIVQDLWEQGAKSVFLLQRSPSMVVSIDSVLRLALGPLYSENNPHFHETSDLLATTTPYKLLLNKWQRLTKIMNENDKELHEGLISAGFQLDYGPNNTGIFAKSATEGGGFYINMGCADLLSSNNEVSIRHANIKCITEQGDIIITNLPSGNSTTTNNDTKAEEEEGEKEEIINDMDVIIYATGFHTLDKYVSEICGEEISRNVGKTWGLGLGLRPHKDPGPWEGELRNMYKPTNMNGLWFHGGNLAQSRYYSKLLSLQLAARFYNVVPTNNNNNEDYFVYGIPKPTKQPAAPNDDDDDNKS